MSMTFSAETEQLARRVAARSGKTLEEVVRDGVEIQARIAGVDIGEARAGRRVDISGAREIAQRIASRPLLDSRPPRDILEQAWGVRDDRRR